MILALALLACAPEAPSGCLTFGGDVMLSRGIAREVREKGDPWAGLSGRWVASLEGAVGTRPEGAPGEGRYFLGIEPDLAPVLGRGPLVALSLATNHAGDLGASGRIATKLALGRAGVEALDEGGGPWLLQV